MKTLALVSMEGREDIELPPSIFAMLVRKQLGYSYQLMTSIQQPYEQIEPRADWYWPDSDIDKCIWGFKNWLKVAS